MLVIFDCHEVEPSRAERAIKYIKNITILII